jgi:tetratricopeptide (TPR) repeat protein
LGRLRPTQENQLVAFLEKGNNRLIKKTTSGLGLALVAILTACQTQPPAPDADLTNEVRQAARSQNGIINVHPVTDPVAEEYIGQARWLEQQERLDEASERVEMALKVSPKDPQYWQFLAELSLSRGHHQEALHHAVRSFELGPQLGELCYRNWLTLSRAYLALDHPEQSAQAERRADACTVKERTTY